MKYIIPLLFCLQAHADIQLIGDKNVCSEFGTELQMRLHSSLTCMPGTGPVYWANHLPDITSETELYVVLGEKDLREKHLDNSYKILADRIAKRTSHCIWIGPAAPTASTAKALNGFYKELKEKVKPCEVIDSRPATMHGESPKVWAQKIK